MTSAATFLAVDLGASSGRVMAGQWDGRRFSLEELHRFPNGGVSAGDTLYWNALGIWSHIQDGLAKYQTRFQNSPDGIGIDAWGVDFALIDRAGSLIGNPVHYRDVRTDGMPERVFAKVGEDEIFAETGVQTMQINTLFQLYSMVHRDDPQLRSATTLLTIPDLFLYLLSGTKCVEYTEATTTQMYAPVKQDWARELLARVGIPLHILPEVVKPGTQISPVRSSVLRDCGFAKPFPAIAVATHDTASAVAAIPDMDAQSAFISSGTWSLMGAEVSEPNTSQEAFRLNLTNEGSAGRSFLLMKNLTGLWIIQGCLRHWNLQGRHYEWSDVMEAAAKSESFRSIFDPNDKRLQVQRDMPGAIQKYCRDTGQLPPETVGAFARCAFESLSLKYRSVLRSLELLTHRDLRTLRVVGGGSLNSFLCQMMADACDRTVVSGPVEASALGNVLLQAIATGHLPDIQSGRASIAESFQRKVFEPHRSDAWDAAYARFKCLEVD